MDYWLSHRYPCVQFSSPSINPDIAFRDEVTCEAEASEPQAAGEEAETDKEFQLLLHEDEAVNREGTAQSSGCLGREQYLFFMTASHYTETSLGRTVWI